MNTQPVPPASNQTALDAIAQVVMLASAAIGAQQPLQPPSPPPPPPPPAPMNDTSALMATNLVSILASLLQQQPPVAPPAPVAPVQPQQQQQQNDLTPILNAISTIMSSLRPASHAPVAAASSTQAPQAAPPVPASDPTTNAVASTLAAMITSLMPQASNHLPAQTLALQQDQRSSANSLQSNNNPAVINNTSSSAPNTGSSSSSANEAATVPIGNTQIPPNQGFDLARLAAAVIANSGVPNAPQVAASPAPTATISNVFASAQDSAAQPQRMAVGLQHPAGVAVGVSEDNSASERQQESGSAGADNHPAERKKRVYRHESFPVKLHRLLRDAETEGNDTIVSYVSDGHAFQVHQPGTFTAKKLRRNLMLVCAHSEIF